MAEDVGTNIDGAAVGAAVVVVIVEAVDAVAVINCGRAETIVFMEDADDTTDDCCRADDVTVAMAQVIMGT